MKPVQRTLLTGWLAVAIGTTAVVSIVQADRWDARSEAREGAREVDHERREAAREIANADTPMERRREVYEGRAEVTQEQVEARSEVRREVYRW